MSASDNKQLMQDIFSELAKGNGQPFVDALANDIQWTWMGTVKWSKTFNGKDAVLNELLNPGTAMLTAPFFTYFAQRFIAEDDYVVVEARGANTLAAQIGGLPAHRLIASRLRTLTTAQSS